MLEIRFFQLCFNESINGVNHPIRSFYFWKIWPSDRLKCPMTLLLLFFFRKLGRGRSRGAYFHPMFEVANLLAGKLFVLRWHLQIFICVANRLNQKTLVRIAGDN